MALDSALDKSHHLTGGNWHAFTASWLHNFLNWKSPQAYSSPGAPPNGSDYVRFKNGSGWMRADQLKSLTFKGAGSLEPDPVEWVLDPPPPDATTAGDSSCG